MLYKNPIPDLPNEQWKIIPDTHDLYYVSNLGRIKKEIVTKSGIQKCTLLTPTLRSSGQYSITLTVSTRYRVSVYISRAMLMAFSPIANPEEMEVLFLDCDYLNTTLENLQWATKGECILHRNDCTSKKPRIKSREYISKSGKTKVKPVLYSDADCQKMVQMYKDGIKQPEIAKRFGCSQPYVSKILNSKLRPELDL